jgi:pyruvate,water dikinase
MSGGIISKESPALATYAVISHDYLNLNMKFGYHFVILDSMCGDDPSQNYISFRFAGGGGQFYQRALRVEFMAQIFSQLEFKVDRKGDLLDVQLTGYDKETIKEKLDIVGRLMGATRLMDMYLKDASMVQTFVDAFMAGRYDFATVREGQELQNEEKDAAHV